MVVLREPHPHLFGGDLMREEVHSHDHSLVGSHVFINILANERLVTGNGVPERRAERSE